MDEKTPSAFSAHDPNLQVVWDSTSLKALQFCPRYYQYSIIEGYTGGTVDLEFGILYASSVEVYKKARLAGKSKSEAQYDAVKYAVEASYVDGKPWGGEYAEQWRCEGTEPYKNAKGNKAKCPWSHKGKWFPAPAPSTCGECGSGTETLRRWIPYNVVKNRVTLVRLVFAYTEEQPEDGDTRGFFPYAFPNGKPAVELSFKMVMPWTNAYGENIVLAGHLDSIMQNADGSEKFISDNKTTKKTLGKGFFDGYSPNTQTDLYDVMGTVLYPDLNLNGVLIEGAQVTSDGARLSAQPLHRTEDQREETLGEIKGWVKQAEVYAQAGRWPMATSNCWICPFRKVCSKSPDKRKMYLDADFQKRKWNPAEER